MSRTTFDEFVNTLSGRTSAAGLHPLLKALSYDANRDWNRAHTIVQGVDGADAARVHAYLHRKEGDDANTSYWYRRADKEVTTIPADEEWRDIARALLTASR
jgi:hypothetical protein